MPYAAFGIFGCAKYVSPFCIGVTCRTALGLNLLSREWLPDAKHGLLTLSTVGLVWSIIIGVRSVPVDEVAIVTNKETILNRVRSWPRSLADSK